MNCFPCFTSKNDENENENNNEEVPVAQVKEEPPVSAPLQSPGEPPPSSLAFKLPTEFFASFTVTKIAIKHLNQSSVLSFALNAFYPVT